MSVTRGNVNLDQFVRTTIIRDLVDHYPATMPVLDRYEVDTCCGGGVTPVSAAEAHGIDVETFVTEIVAAIEHRAS